MKSKLLLVSSVLLVACFSTLVFAAKQPSFTLEQVLSSPFPSELTSAEKANRVAWVFDEKGVRNIWVADAPGFEARQVTHYTDDNGEPISSLRLTPDGRIAVYVRGSEVNGKDEVADPTSSVHQRKQQVWAVDVDKGDPLLLGDMGCDDEGCEDVEISPDGTQVVWAGKRQLWVAPIDGKEKAKQLAFTRGNNAEPRWSPDGKKIAFVSKRGDHSLTGVYEFGKDRITWLAPSVDRDALPRWSADGQNVAFVRRNGRQQKQRLIPLIPQPWSIWLADVSTGKGRPIWRSGRSLDDSFPGLTEHASFHFAGNDRIVFSSEQDGWNHLYSVPASGGTATLLTPGKFEVENVHLSSDSKSVLFTSNQDDIDRRHIWRVAVDGGTPQAVTRGQTLEWSPVETADGKHLLFFGSSATSPAMPYLLTADGREMIAKDALPVDFPSAELVTPRQVVFKSEDGWTIHGQLFEPTNRTGKLPALVFIHGGSMRQMMLGFHNMYYYHNAYAMNEYLVSQGYVVLSVNYRTGIMYGRSFRTPPDGGWRGGAEYKDIVAAGRYLQSLPNVNAAKIGLWGGSYGGYLTAMGLARNSNLFAAGVDMHGVHDWSTLEDFPKDAPDLEEAKKLAFESSPDASVATWKSPVLLIQGDDDRNVDFSQMVTLVQLLRAHDVPFEEIVFPDEIHDFLRWHSWLHAYQASADFFARQLKQGETLQKGN